LFKNHPKMMWENKTELKLNLLIATAGRR